MRGLEKVRLAVARAAGWPWCDEHRRARYDGSNPCDDQHPKQRVEGWQDYNPMLRDEPAGDELIDGEEGDSRG